jgi:hypothetical protein
MEETARLVAELQLGEFHFRVQEDQLWITPRERLSSSQIERIKRLKAQIIELLKTCCPKCRRPLSTNEACWKCHWRRCFVCGKETGSEFIATCAPCGATLED